MGEDYWTWSERKDKIFDNELKKGRASYEVWGGSGINENERKFIIKIKGIK